MPPSQADMIEATRLTRAGRLAEATALLRGQAAPLPTDRALIDMEPPSAPGQAWTAPAGLGGLQGLPSGLNLNLANLRGKLPGQAPVVDVPPGARFEERMHSGPAGARPYKLYVPSTLTERPALLVMLHGCTQSPDAFAAGTRMNEVAEEHGFLVAYPGQTPGANIQKCWNWFDAAHQRRDGGEAAILAALTREVIAEHGADPARVFVAGLSAGGAQAAILGATHPDLFAAVGVHSGLACGAASDMPGAFAAMRAGGGASLGALRPIPTIVFHGDRDATVAPVNAEEVANQAGAREAHATEVETGRAPGGQRFTRTVHRDRDGTVLLEQWLLHGAGHAWSGGSAAGSYTDPSGPDASRAMVGFFLRRRSDLGQLSAGQHPEA